ncbi:MAG: Ppx/GppA family phosphatase [Xanthobacteraceae bacterium]|nr:MAG: Ppx/GppA family phosphatase [Xanthobacteraceae bacterium]
MADDARRDGFGPRDGAPGSGRASKLHVEADRANGYGVHALRRIDGNAGRRGQTYAALDLGTNNCRLLIARPSDDGFRVVDSFSRIIRLGEGVSGSGRLGEAAMARALEALRICRDKMDLRGVSRTRTIATEACRAASNAGAFRSRVRDELGIDLEVIDRETEALLAATGCTPLIDAEASGVILFDIGGGSSEVVRMDSASIGRAGPRVRGWASLPVGVVTLAERHGGMHVSRASYAAMIADVSAHLAAFARDHGDDLAGLHLLGTSGTVTTIAGIHLELPRYDRRRVDGIWMSDEEITRTVERLVDMPYEDRVANACIGSERADLVLAGCAILDAIRRAFPCPRLRIADRGLREGMLLQMMREDGAIRAR